VAVTIHVLHGELNTAYVLLSALLKLVSTYGLSVTGDLFDCSTKHNRLH
jgi:prophage tail gpP-like protein